MDLKRLPLFALLAALGLALYLLVTGARGFPLDDAWIHQTYARNLGQLGQFAFMPGAPSAGSTSPLWTGLLAIGYALRVDYGVWTFGLGWALLTLCAWLGHRLSLRLWPEKPRLALLIGIGIALEWHLLWAAASGMETLLFIALALAAFVLPTERSGWLGVIVGLSVLARPDGLMLLPFVLARVWLTGAGRWARLGWLLAGFALIFVPYLAFNVALSGAAWPNTFYAKQAEYAILRELPLWQNLLKVSLPPVIGGPALLLPGVVVALYQVGRTKRREALIPLGWGATVLVAYALRLPVDYQHGRYVMPVIPIVILIGAGGMAQIVQLSATTVIPRVLSRAWALALALVSVVFVGLGAQTYSTDVTIIETEMVATARWVNACTAPDAKIAAHDIGALGYFGGRPIWDLAGLVSPDVIPFIRDEAHLAQWLETVQANYVMTFPGWYPQLAQRYGPPVFQTKGVAGPRAGGENMAVYCVRGACARACPARP